jgi:hypothetical protein
VVAVVARATGHRIFRLGAVAGSAPRLAANCSCGAAFAGAALLSSPSRSIFHARGDLQRRNIRYRDFVGFNRSDTAVCEQSSTSLVLFGSLKR